MLKEDEEKLARDSVPLTNAQMQELMSRVEKLERGAADERNTIKIRANLNARLSIPLLKPEDLE